MAGSTVKQEGGDGVDGRAVEHLAVGVAALGDMQHAHDDRRLAGPLDGRLVAR